MSDLNDFCDVMDHYLYADDKDRFVKLFQKFGPRLDNFLVGRILIGGDKKCITALLSGEVSDPDPPPSVTEHILECATVFNPRPYIVDLLMKNCHGIDYLKRADPEKNPLPGCLGVLCFADPVYYWLRGEDSLIKLIILLFHPETKGHLDMISILARYTDYVNDIAYSCARAGNLIGLAGILLVARDKVMAPFGTGMTIKEVVTNEVTAGNADDPSCISNLVEAHLLLCIFERLGDKLSSYYASVPKRASVVQMVTNVVALFAAAGFSLTPKDLDFTGCLSPQVCKALEKSPVLQAFGALSKGYCYEEERLCPSHVVARDSMPITSRPKWGEKFTSASYCPRHFGDPSKDFPPLAASMTPARNWNTSQVGGWMKKHGGSTTSETKSLVEALRAPPLEQLAYITKNLKKDLKIL